jgi:hypothetical protein
MDSPFLFTRNDGSMFIQRSGKSATRYTELPRLIM